mgnify:CR=1 FL=1
MKKDIYKNDRVLLVIGDSFTEGQGAEPWFYDLEKDNYLNTKLMNLGIMGSGPMGWLSLTNHLKEKNSLNIDGVIATNTTLSRVNLKSSKKNETGGLSGLPLKDKSTDVIKFLHKKSKNAFPIIGVGGVHRPDDAIEKLNAGASLVQMYTGFIYEGPGVVKRINKALLIREKI